MAELLLRTLKVALLCYAFTVISKMQKSLMLLLGKINELPKSLLLTHLPVGLCNFTAVKTPASRNHPFNFNMHACGHFPSV
jgi:hypothetical protein